MDDAVAKDRDEIRRLLYMAYVAPRTKRYNLVGTLINALAHHGSNIPAAESTEKILQAVELDDEDAKKWIVAQIQRLTAEER